MGIYVDGGLLGVTDEGLLAELRRRQLGVCDCGWLLECDGCGHKSEHESEARRNAAEIAHSHACQWSPRNLKARLAQALDTLQRANAATVSQTARAETAERAEQVATERLIIAMKAPAMAPPPVLRVIDTARACAVCGDVQTVEHYGLCLESTKSVGPDGDADDAYICDADAPKVLAAVRALRCSTEYPAVDPLDLLCEDA